MIPVFKIDVGGEDYTAIIMDKLVELRLVDQAGWKSDYVEILLDDRDTIPEPTHGAEIKLHLGYDGQSTIKKGVYVHDETTFLGPTLQMRVHAAAVNFRDKLKAARTRSFNDVTLKEVLTGIAASHGYSAYIDEFLADIVIPHIDQTTQSDLQLLTRLSAQYGATFKAAGTSLIMLARGSKRSEAVKDALGSVTLTPQDVTRWSVVRQDKSRYSGVRANWWDYDAASMQSVVAGDESGNVRELPMQHADKDTAWAAASAELERLIRSKATADITMPGRPDLVAEGELILKEFRSGVDDEYTITRVESVITKRGGYTCKIQAEIAK